VRASDKSVVIWSPEELFQACESSTSNLGSAGDRHNSYLWKLQVNVLTDILALFSFVVVSEQKP
jgi:hypothetical protein